MLRLLLIYICIVSHFPTLAAVDVFGQGGDDEVEKTWTREEISALKDEIKNDYRLFLKKRDLWSALQLEAWVQSLHLDIKFSTLLGDRVVGNPLYAFPQGVRSVFDHGDWVAVVNGEQVNFINGEGRPTHPRVKMPHYLGQAGITSSRSHIAGMRFRISGEEPNLNFYYLCSVAPTDGGETWSSGWLDLGRPIKDNYPRQMPVAHDGSAAGVHFLAPDRNQDFCVIIRPGRSHITVDNLRNPVAVGERGNWIMGYNPADRRWQFIQGDKRSDIRRCTGVDSYGALLSINGKALEFVAPNGNRKAINAQTNTDTRMWSFDKWLVVQLGSVTEQEPDKKDVFGNVIKKGESKTVYKTALFKWTDLAAGNVDPSHELIGDMRICDQRPNSIMTWKGRDIILHDCNGDEIQAHPFASFKKDIEKIQIRENGIRVVTKDWKNHMLDYHGKTIYECDNGYLVMLHPSVLGHFWDTKDGEKVKHHCKVINFTETGDAFETIVPGPNNENEYELDIHFHGWYGRRYLDNRNWLYFDLFNGNVIREGHVAENAEPVRQWGLPKHGRLPGRFNAFSGRLIPKWVTKQQSLEDRLYPRDAMYTRGGLMVITDDEQLRSYDKNLLVKDHYKDAQFWSGRFVVQDKDINTYITSWMDGEHKAKYYIDASGRLKTIPKPQALDGQRPEGEWKIDGQHLYIPRQGQIRWPDEMIGFSPVRIRSRKGVRDLLIITRSLVIELDSGTAKKIFAR